MTQQRKTIRPLVFLHGWGTDSWVWHRQISHFQHTRPIHGPTIVRWRKETVLELFDDNGLDEAILIGWSLGGMLALETFAKLKHRLAGIVLVGASARFCRGHDHPMGDEAVRLRAMKQRLHHEMASTLKDFFGLFFTSQEKLARIDFEGFSKPSMCAESCREGLEYLMRKDLRPLLPLVDKPTLIVHGEHDQIAPLGQAEYLHRSIEGSTLLILEGCGHMPFYSRARIFNNTLEDFCRVC